MNETKLKILCNELLFSMLGNKELVDKWWISYNKAFDCPPLEKWDKDSDSVYKYIMQCAEGMW